MKKINVIGTTGSGKSTLSKVLAEKLDCPYIQMDQLLFKPNWEETADDEFFAKVDKATSGESWVLDGNYSRTSKLKWQRVDTIIWVDYSYSRTLLQLFKRSIARIISGHELWEGTGNKETFSKTFLSKSSILVWFFKGYSKNRKRYLALMDSPSVEHIKFVWLKSPSEVRQFLKQLKN